MEVKIEEKVELKKQESPVKYVAKKKIQEKEEIVEEKKVESTIKDKNQK
jgi:hypothetical protein